ncbi:MULTISPECIES: hypothetical protein [unclassified Rathayibacter]|uniref:hypothetical protein n=1 Tax=unclassified Rathayibacter TaxID=2609250 RepID=UPI001FB314F8|nr:MULTISPECIES: hypothetical protein [unclassified Rathayibacter]MCJ1673043.1 hypothetical protein [Rathayibacter sp. VKM Ac-2929]MCJ1682539.1 hypothetical protein [Rathayibacter sp. VKM Ac-2928]
MTPRHPARTLLSGAVVLATAGALLLGAPPALAAGSGPVTTAVATAANVFTDALVSGEQLARGESIVSVGGGYRFVLQTDGNAVTYDASGRATFSTGTQGRGDRLVMQADGNLVIYAADGRPVWFTGTGDETGASVRIQNDGNLVVSRANGAPAWASSIGTTIAAPPTDSLYPTETLRAGQRLTSGDGRFTAVMQGDGNFVGYGPNGVTWSTGTSGDGNRFVLQEDGNAVIYGADGSVKWFTGTSGSGVRMNLDNAGRLVLYSLEDAPLWSSRTAFPNSTLFAPAALYPGEGLRSGNGAYRAVMQADGNFVVYGPAGAIWSTGNPTPGAVLSLEDDGFMSVSSRGGVSWTVLPRYFVNVGPAVPPFRLVMQDDGNLVQYDGRGRASWSSR